MEPIPYRFYLTGRSGTREAFPLNGNALAVKWQAENENAYLRKQLTGKITFIGDDYNFIYLLEKSVYRCDVIDLRIDILCGGNYVLYEQAQLILNKGTFDTDKCNLEIEPTVADLYTCWDNNSSTEYNLFSYVFERVNLNLLRGTIEIQECSTHGLEPAWCGADPDPFTHGWTIVSNRTLTDDADPIHGGSQTNTFAREVINLAAGQTLPYPWVLVDVPSNKWARSPIIYGYQSGSYDTNSFWFKYTYGGSFDNGLRLRAVFQAFMNLTCYGYNLKSNFFQWNPDTVTTINYATGAESEVLNLALFQKSDVKRPGADNNATIATISFEDLLKDICNTYNLKWWIDESNNFNIEHVSFTNRVVGIDSRTRYDKELRAGMNKYTYDNDSVPKKETFAWSDNAYGDFGGKPIIYNTPCAGLGNVDTNDISVSHLFTDVIYCLQNPAADSSALSDDGFVLIALDAGDNFYIKPPILGGFTLNNVLSWAYLHVDYWRDRRPFHQFIMNDVNTLAKSILATKKQSGLQFKLCCGDHFNPDELITTDLGDGQVDNPTINLYKQILTCDLLYPADLDLVPNDSPVAVNDTAITFKNLSIIIDVLANDYDDDGTIQPNTLAITSQPSHGSAEITPDFKIKYTPATDYTGADFLFYSMQDDLSQPSNTGIVTITVKPGTPLPIAGDDTFIIAKNKTLNVGNLLSNDTGDGALSCVPETKATTRGNVQIFANGAFTYTPTTNYVGPDSFDYTLKDSNNNTDTGTANITVFEPATVYVKYTEENPHTVDITNICDGGPATVGTQDLIDQHFKFYSNAGGTVPLNVDGYVLVLSMHKHIVVDADPATDVNYNISGSGTQVVVIDQLELERLVGCDHEINQNTTITYTLNTSPDYNIL